MKPRIFIFNHHTPYLYLLSFCNVELFCIGDWDYSQRPKPKNVSLINSKQVQNYFRDNDILILQKPSDFIKLHLFKNRKKNIIF